MEHAVSCLEGPIHHWQSGIPSARAGESGEQSSQAGGDSEAGGDSSGEVVTEQGLCEPEMVAERGLEGPQRGAAEGAVVWAGGWTGSFQA